MTAREKAAILYCIGYVRHHAGGSTTPLPTPDHALAEADIAAAVVTPLPMEDE